MADVRYDIKLPNPYLLVTGDSSILSITFPLNDNNWQFGLIKNMSAEAALFWEYDDSVCYTVTDAIQVVYNDVTYYKIKVENIMFKEEPPL